RAQTACTTHVDSASTPLDSAIVAAMKEFSVPGAAVAVVRDGRVEHLAGYGCANLERGIPVDPRGTVFQVASGSHPFVARPPLRFAEQGTVALHADVNRYLRGMQVPTG